MSFTNQSKNTTTFTNESKSSTSFSNESLTLEYFDLLIDTTYKLLIDTTYKLRIGDSSSTPWTNQTKN